MKTMTNKKEKPLKMDAGMKFRITAEDRLRLDEITKMKKTTNPGYKLSDLGREIMAEYIQRHEAEAKAKPIPQQKLPRLGHFALPTADAGGRVTSRAPAHLVRGSCR